LLRFSASFLCDQSEEISFVFEYHQALPAGHRFIPGFTSSQETGKCFHVLPQQAFLSGQLQAKLGVARYPGPYQCVACAHVTSLALGFCEHAKKHKAVPKLRCSTCSRDYKFIHGIAAHLAKAHRRAQGVHEAERESATTHGASFRCALCTQNFSTPSRLNLHKRRHGGSHLADWSFDRQVVWPTGRLADWSFSRQ
ncbi:zinc finger, C2H2 type, partial [Trichuris suis]